EAAPPANLYVLAVFLTGGPTSEEFANKVISRTIEIRGDQTLGHSMTPSSRPTTAGISTCTSFNSGSGRSIRTDPITGFRTGLGGRKGLETPGQRSWTTWA